MEDLFSADVSLLGCLRAAHLLWANGLRSCLLIPGSKVSSHLAFEEDMTSQEAKRTIASLAHGIDPVTGEVLPQGAVTNYPTVIRALFIALEAIELNSHRPVSRHANCDKAGTPWTEDEEDQLLRACEADVSIDDLCKLHRRSISAIKARLVKLGRINRAKHSWRPPKKPLQEQGFAVIGGMCSSGESEDHRQSVSPQGS